MSENQLVVNAEGPETRVGVIENGRLAEYFLERKRDRGIVGNIYRAKVSRVLPGMQAAFVDLGPTVERAAFLHVGDLLGSADERKLFDDNESGDQSPEGTAARIVRSKRKASQRKIEDLIKPKQYILVQVVKDPIAMKGARVTGYLSLPGRYGVLMPAVDHVGVSKRVSSDGERKRLKRIVDAARPKGMGFIVRTAAEGAKDQEVADDVAFLGRLWGEIGARVSKMQSAGLVYTDLDLVLRTIRDLLHEDTKEIVIDDEEQYQRARKFAAAFLPGYVDRVQHYQSSKPIFDHYGIERAVKTALSRRVPLKSGGHLVIDQSEALTAIDVNTGSFVGRDDLEDTVTKNNLEACEEIAAQLRLRNIGGIIVLDFVDMDKEGNRRKVWEAFQKALAADRSHCNLTKISELGLVEMTRKRTRESLVQLLTDTCPTCAGDAVVKSTTTVAHEILREVRRVGGTVATPSIDVECTSAVAKHLTEQERVHVDELEKRFHKKLDVKVTNNLRPDVFKVAGKTSEIEELPKKRGRGRGGSDGNTGRSRGGRGRGDKDRRPSASEVRASKAETVATRTSEAAQTQPTAASVDRGSADNTAKTAPVDVAPETKTAAATSSETAETTDTATDAPAKKPRARRSRSPRSRAAAKDKATAAGSEDKAPAKPRTTTKSRAAKPAAKTGAKTKTTSSSKTKAAAKPKATTKSRAAKPKATSKAKTSASADASGTKKKPATRSRRTARAPKDT